MGILLSARHVLIEDLFGAKLLLAVRPLVDQLVEKLNFVDFVLSLDFLKHFLQLLHISHFLPGGVLFNRLPILRDTFHVVSIHFLLFNVPIALMVLLVYLSMHHTQILIVYVLLINTLVQKAVIV